MKKIFGLFLIILCSLVGHAQTSYYDALALKAFLIVKPADSAHSVAITTLDDGRSKDIYSILQRYSFDSQAKAIPGMDQGIKKYFGCGGSSSIRENPFLCPYLAILPAANVHISSFLSGLGNTDVTALADGIAKLLVDQTKKTIDEAFFRKLAQFLNEFPELRTLFPNTNTLVTTVNSWEFSNLLNTLREAFDKDIKLLLADFIKLKDLSQKDCTVSDGKTTCINESWCKDCHTRMDEIGKFFRETNIGLYFMSATQIGNGILQSQKVPDIIHSVVDPNFLLGFQDLKDLQLQSDVRNSLELVDILSFSLRSQESGRSYITENQFTSLLNDSVLTNLYLGLLFQQIRNANQGTGIVIHGLHVLDLLIPKRFQGFLNYLTNLFASGKDLQTCFDRLHDDKLAGKTDTSPDLGLVFESFHQFFQSLTATTIIDAQLTFPKNVDTVLQQVDKVLQIAHDVTVRNYNAVVIGTLSWLSDATKPLLTSNPQLADFTAGFVKYGSLAANVVLAKNSDEVEKSIEAFILPTGSASLKKHSSSSINLNAYVGFTYGHLKPQHKSFITKDAIGNVDTVQISGGSTLGIYAPLGVAFNWGLGWRRKSPWSFSAFVSLIDLGAIVGYRFNTDTGQLSNTFKVSLSNILAPGGNIIIGLPNIPISFGGGVQYVPTLQRDARSNSFYNLDQSGFRFHGFIAMDLALLNFHTSKKTLTNVKKIN